MPSWEWDKYVLETIRTLSLLAWPAVALVAVIVFRKQLRDVIVRVRKASLGGVELEAPAQQAPAKPFDAAATVAPPALTKPSETISRIMKQFEAALATVPPNERELRLLRALAETDLPLHMERTYRAILRSQILLLKRLNLQSTMSKSDARKNL